MSSNLALQEIASWQIEALDDNNIRYFYEIDEIKPLLTGNKNFVIGRKGTGKTAIATHITTLDDFENFSVKMSFKNFPWNRLYNLEDKDFTPPNQYISAWKIAILSAVLKLNLKSDSCSPAVRDLCAAVFPNAIDSELRSGFSKLMDRGFNATLAGFGGGIKERRQETPLQGISDFAERLETFTADGSVAGKFYVIFDELDEDYKDILIKPDHTGQFFQLLTSLFKAAQHIRHAFSEGDARIVPLILLRSDIYDLLRDPDKNKWRDRAIDLNWSPPMLRRLLTYRVSRALDADGPPLSFDAAWNEVFAVDETRYGHSKSRRMGTFNYILTNTYLRPRDLISYVRECAKAAIENDRELITNEEIRQADERHSLYSRRELVDEIQSVVEDIDEIFDAISEGQKPAMPYSEFLSLLEAYVVKRPRKDDLNAEKLIELLFYFGVIGNLDRGGQRTFGYFGSHVLLRRTDSVCLHRSLFKSLQL